MAIIVAVPSHAPGGLEAELSQHFGHCDVFTKVVIEDGEVKEVSALPSIPHEQGGCMAPVQYLAAQGVKALVAGGMGMRPLMGFNSVGIEVFHNMGLNKVGQAIEALTEGRLPRFGQENTCGGGGGQMHGSGGASG
ncbi:MAG: dinitrogenase iron-molybdenum cofactor biosynthesis protein [Proteobacteria bacterium]|nr:dinitrogenase iron-molybdenum cofactor biosynthesis protein [Pseudomonadota bacterium]